MINIEYNKNNTFKKKNMTLKNARQSHRSLISGCCTCISCYYYYHYFKRNFAMGINCPKQLLNLSLLHFNKILKISEKIHIDYPIFFIMQ